MIAQRLDRTLTCYRIGDPEGRFPVFDAGGSRLYPGRWNGITAPMIYAARSYSTALLEKLVHGSGRLPPNQHWIAITLPHGLSYEVLEAAALPGWDDGDPHRARAFGSAWQREKRSAVLLVPSLVARVEENVLINPEHPEFARIEASLPRPVLWDRRLFTGG